MWLTAKRLNMSCTEEAYMDKIWWIINSNKSILRHSVRTYMCLPHRG